MSDASFFTALKANPGLIVALALCIGPALVLTLFVFIMRGAGASLRPLVFIAGLLLPVVGTFVVGQLVRARAPSASKPGAALAVRDGRFVEREKLFGPGISAELIRDAKTGLPGILDEAEAAEVGMTPSGETVLVAQFADEERLKRASAAYWRGFQLRNTSGDEESGWRGTRMQGDYLEMQQTSRQLFVWTGLTKESAAARRAASDLASQFPALKPAVQDPLFPALQRLETFFAPAGMKVAGLLLLVAIYSVWFFKGSAWASSEPAAAGVPATPAGELSTRLLAINALDVPFTITQGATVNEFIADWRYTDAKWMDLARLHGMRRTFRIKLTLDESSHVVRATDYTASMDWSAGPNAASLQWQAGSGIVFFQREQVKVLGLQLDAQGRFKPELSYSYRFDLNELKSPLKQAVTHSGWTWRPTAWQGPVWLRWLTE